MYAKPPQGHSTASIAGPNDTGRKHGGAGGLTNTVAVHTRKTINEKDTGTNGPMDHRTLGPMRQRTLGTMGQGTNGPEEFGATGPRDFGNNGAHIYIYINIYEYIYPMDKWTNGTKGQGGPMGQRLWDQWAKGLWGQWARGQMGQGTLRPMGKHNS